MINIFAMGSIYESLAAESFIKAIKNCQDIKLHFISFQKLNIPNVKSIQAKNDQEIISLLSSADILYLYQSADNPDLYKERLATTLPTKLFDYISLMKPIFVHTTQRSHLYDFCLKNKIGAICTSWNAKDIIHAIRNINYNIDVNNTKRFIKEYDSQKISKIFLDLLLK